MAMVNGKLGSGMVGCGDRGGVCRSRWFAIAASIISMAITSEVVVDVGVVMVVVKVEEMSVLH